MAKRRPTAHARGKKVTDQHSTLIYAATYMVEAAKGMPEIKKIALGRIQTLGNGDPRVKFVEESPTCLRAQVRGRNNVQEIRFYVTEASVDKAAVIRTLTGALRI